MSLRYVIIADPNSKRWRTYEQELRAYWRERRTPVEIRVLSWLDVIQRDGRIEELLGETSRSLLRIESPGRDFEVTRALLLAGDRAAGVDRTEQWSSLPVDRGRLVAPGLVYRGLHHVLVGLQATLDGVALPCSARPLDVAEMFDKNATCDRLAGADLPTPERLAPPQHAADLLHQLVGQGYWPGYVKLAYGASASGIVVVSHRPPQSRGLSTMLARNGGYYNTRRLQELEGSDLEAALQFLLDEGACVQRGIRMETLEERNFDVRVIVINGAAEFAVFRLSKWPITNLHLGGRRGDPFKCREAIPKRRWLDALDHCVEAASLYDSRIVGVDVVFERGFGQHYLLELNPFGDFFPGYLNDRGQSVHRVEIESTARQLQL